MVEKYFQLNISSVAFHSPIFIFKRLVTVKKNPTFATIIYTCTKNLNAVKVGTEARKKHNMQLKLCTFILKYA